MTGPVPPGRAGLVIWSRGSGGWLECALDEIVWLDRRLLSASADQTLHRRPRCAGLRYVHRRWELFSRDPTHLVYVAPYRAGSPMSCEAVEAAAAYVLPVATAQHETLPVLLADGAWLVSVGQWVLALRINVLADSQDQPTDSPGDDQPPTAENRSWANGTPSRGNPPRPDAAANVRAFFDRNGMACMTIAYYYQHFIRGTMSAPQTVPMTEVAIALDLNGPGTVSDYKRELQRCIWKEQGHQRELPEFLLGNGLLTQTDLDRALKLADAHERTGRADKARERLQYLQGR
jgi:hypothetical protein